MSYFYDLHVHSSECSGCAASSVETLVAAEKAEGYSGFVLTNHFLTGNNCIPKELSWEEKVKCYWNAYLLGKAAGERLDFDVIFGLEHNYGNAQEILIYGIDLDFLLANPDFCSLSGEEICDRVHACGGFVSHAHPFRERGYIPKGNNHLDYSYLDAIEIYNSANTEREDERAMELCERLGLAYTAGNDMHYALHFATFPHAGLVFDRRIKTSEELVSALRNREGRLQHSGERFFK